MSSTGGDDAEMINESWWKEEYALSPLQSSITHVAQVPTGFTREYRLLAEVCASLRSGFMLLNRGERVVYSNASALRLLRISKPDLTSARDFDVRGHLLTLVSDPRQAQDELERIWLHPEQEYATELALADAAVRWLRVHSFPVRDEQGALLGRGMLFDDITLQRSVTESRSETLALAAHELKTPLTIIKGCATTLLGSSARWDPAMQREMLQMIDTQSDRLYDILNTLLDVWRLDAGTQHLRLTLVHIPELLQPLLTRWRRQAPSHSFLLTVSPDLPRIVCDAVRIEQTLNHMLSNAVTYSPAGKTIHVRVETTAEELRIAVLDEGIGIAEEHLERIFERFYRIEQEDVASKGSGLGLAAARATVEAHGGKIWADSAGLEQGTTFYLTLPFAPRRFSLSQNATNGSTDVAPQHRVIRTSLLKQDHRPRVLLAEGDARLTRYLRANLEEQHYRVHTVSHGVQFLRQLDLEEFDMILLSTHLADMSGIELLQRLREFSQAPVIMLCNDCDEDERVQLFDFGSDDLVVKPFGMKELLARVRALLRRQSAPPEQAANQALFTTGELVIDHAQHLVMLGDQPVQLSRTEYKLLSVLAQHVGMVVTHELLLEKVWGPEYNRDIDFIWVYISRLRRKIESDSRRPKYILTVPDVGYKLAKLSS